MSLLMSFSLREKQVAWWCHAVNTKMSKTPYWLNIPTWCLKTGVLWRWQQNRQTDIFLYLACYHVPPRITFKRLSMLFMSKTHILKYVVFRKISMRCLPQIKKETTTQIFYQIHLKLPASLSCYNSGAKFQAHDKKLNNSHGRNSDYHRIWW